MLFLFLCFSLYVSSFVSISVYIFCLFLSSLPLRLSSACVFHLSFCCVSSLSLSLLPLFPSMLLFLYHFFTCFSLAVFLYLFPLIYLCFYFFLSPWVLHQVFLSIYVYLCTISIYFLYLFISLSISFYIFISLGVPHMTTVI